MSWKVAASPKSLYVRTGKSDIQGKADRHSRYQQTMLERSLMIAADVVKPRAKPVLHDALDDL